MSHLSELETKRGVKDWLYWRWRGEEHKGKRREEGELHQPVARESKKD